MTDDAAALRAMIEGLIENQALILNTLVGNDTEKREEVLRALSTALNAGKTDAKARRMPLERLARLMGLLPVA